MCFLLTVSGEGLFTEIAHSAVTLQVLKLHFIALGFVALCCVALSLFALRRVMLPDAALCFILLHCICYVELHYVFFFVSRFIVTFA